MPPTLPPLLPTRCSWWLAPLVDHALRLPRQTARNHAGLATQDELSAMLQPYAEPDTLQAAERQLAQRHAWLMAQPAMQQ